MSEELNLDPSELGNAIAESLNSIEAQFQELQAEEIAEEAARIQEQGIEHAALDELPIHSTKCLKCSYLVERAKERYTNCHYSKGNQDCPAREVRIIVRIPADRISDQLVDYFKGGNTAKMAELFAKLDRQNEGERQRTLEMFQKKLAAS